ncbi:MAG: sulfatase-like hydrolase/transferase, partial [Deltaproteobacteria bacterium]|nr:sulfatase-like hydrolase/transferase [Deltaproteobacteria bacterium]
MTFLRRTTLISSLLFVLPSCERAQPVAKSSDEAALQALHKSLEWLAANPPNPADAQLGEIGTDAWSWAQIAKLHPSAAVRERAKQEARKRLGQLEPAIELTPVELSYWVVLLRSMNEVGIDTSPYLAALSESDLRQALTEMSPTTALWTSGLLRFAGIAIEFDPAATEVATGAASSDWIPTRVAPRVFNERQLDFVRRALPQLLRVCIAAQDTDAAGEVLIAAAILDQRGRRYYVDGIRWLLAQQQSDGTYRSGRDGERTSASSNFRHVVLIGSWAVLESLQRPPSRTQDKPQAPNVVVLSIDTLRADSLRAYNPSAKPHSTLDRMVQRGHTFDRAYSTASWTLPAHVSLFTGLCPDRHGVVDPRYAMGDVSSFVERLHEKGYQTVGFTDGGYMGAQYGFTRGFENYNGWHDGKS